MLEQVNDEKALSRNIFQLDAHNYDARFYVRFESSMRNVQYVVTSLERKRSSKHTQSHKLMKTACQWMKFCRVIDDMMENKLRTSNRFAAEDDMVKS